MTDQATAPCPRCESPLTVCPIPDGGMGWCERCYGIWLDNQACQALIGERLSDAGREKVLWVTQKKTDQAPPNEAAQDGPIPCPVCHGYLNAFVTDQAQHGARVALDVCPSHGTWFDHGEAWALLQALSLKHAELDIDLENDAQDRAWKKRNALFRRALKGAFRGMDR